MPNTTSNFTFNLPKVNNAEDEDLWGTQLNSNWTATDGFLIRNTSTQTATSFNVSATADFNLQYLIDTSSNVVQADLPALSGVVDGYEVHFKVIDTTNTFTIDGNSSELIDGATTFVTTTAVTLVADKTATVWRSVADITDVTVIPGATTAVRGIQETSTDTEAKAMSAIDKFVVPGNLGAMNATPAEVAAGIITNEFMSPGNFSANLSDASNGFYTLPGGFTLQWGTSGSVASGGTLTVTFPTAFTTAYSVALTGIKASSVNDNPYLNAAPTTTNFVIRAGTNGFTTVSWIATGTI